MARKKASFLSFIFGMLFGIVLLIGSVAFAGYWAFNNLTIGHIEQLTGQKFDFIDEDSVLRTKAIKDFAADLAGLPELEIQAFAETYGITFPAEVAFFTEALGDVKIKDIPNAGQLIAERVKLGYFFGNPYNDFATYPDDYDDEKPSEADSVLWKLRTYTIAGPTGISTLGDNMLVEEVRDIFGLTLPSFLETDEILQSPLSQLGEAVDNLPVTSLLTEPETNATIGDRIVGKMFTMTVIDAENPGGRPYNFSEIDDLFADLPNALTIRDIIYDEPDTSTAYGRILHVLWSYDYDPDDSNDEDYLKLNDIGTVTITFELADILPEPGPEYNTTNNLLRFLSGYEVDEIELALDEMTIMDIFATQEEDETEPSLKGILALLPESTPVTGLDAALTDRLKTITIQEFINAGVIDDSSVTNDDIRDLSLDEIVDFLNTYYEMFP